MQTQTQVPPELVDAYRWELKVRGVTSPMPKELALKLLQIFRKEFRSLELEDGALPGEVTIVRGL